MCQTMLLLKYTSLLACCTVRSIILYTSRFIFFYLDCLFPSFFLYCGSLSSLIHSLPLAKSHHLRTQVKSCCMCAVLPPSSPPSAAWPWHHCRWEARERRQYRYELWNGKKLCLQCSTDESEEMYKAEGGGRWGGRRRCIWKVKEG